MTLNRLQIKQALQLKEILEHKYYLSEKKHEDIGLLNTLSDWINGKYNTDNGASHAERFDKAFKEHLTDILAECKKYCQEQCQANHEACRLMSIYRIHEILKD